MIKLSKSDCFAFLALLTMMPPYAITTVPAVKTLLNILQILIFLRLALSTVQAMPRVAVFVVGVVYALIVAFSTVWNGSGVYSAMVFVFDFAGFLMLICYLAEKDQRNAVRQMYTYYFVLCMINYVYLLINSYALGKEPDDSLFITVPNSLTAPLVFALVLAVLDCRWNNGGKVRADYVILTAALIHTELLVWSGTGLVGFFILIIYLAVLLLIRKPIRVNFWLLMIVGIALSVGIVIFRLQYLFAFLVEDVLGKDLTFTGRTGIWDHYLAIVDESWLIGYGKAYKEAYGGFFAHNGFLDIMITGGALCMSCFAVMLGFAGRSAKACKNTVEGNVIVVAMFSFAVMMIAEMPEFSYLVAMMVLLHYVAADQATAALEPKNG